MLMASYVSAFLSTYSQKHAQSFLYLHIEDVNVMMFALQMKNLQAIWFDKRKSLSSIRPPAALGFILNVPSSSR